VELFDQLEKMVDSIINDDQPLTYGLSTILHTTAYPPLILRSGLGWELAQAGELRQLKNRHSTGDPGDLAPGRAIGRDSWP
jgi:tRNA A37 threonylcarbamoyladenosine synthetase subunit TsaC/SUA5/YrdC